MKKYILLITTVVFASYSCMQSRIIPQGESVCSSYRVKRIKTKKSAYVIYAERNDSIFKLFSERNVTDIPNCEKIKRGNYYDFDLRLIFPIDSLLGQKLSPNLGIKGFGYKNGVTIKIEEKSHNALYIADNLNGLCFLRKD